ncbi:MAG: DedA family protein [Phycisphaerae bacterium]|nr:DedA family protein [Phycisphaerae bacterium]
MEVFFREVIGQWSHVGLFVVLMAAGFGLPLPEDVPLVLAGVIVRQASGHELQPLILMMFTGLAGVIVGDSCLFWIGRLYGQGVLDRRWIQRFAKPWLVDKARHKFERHGAKILFVARFMPGLRAIMFLIAGTFRLPYWKLLAFDGGAALISVPVWIWLGWYIPEKIGAIFSNTKMATYVILGALAAALAGWAVWEYYHNLRKRNAETAAAEAAAAQREIAPAPANTEGA